MSRLTLLFCKRPQAGQVKTRLCPPLEPQVAADLALAMLTDLEERHRGESAYRSELAIAPAEELAWFEKRFQLPARVQRGADLAERLTHAFEDGLREASGVVILGTDVPLLPRATVIEAHEQLEEGQDLVLCPDLGGGYGLIGLRRPVPELFAQVVMSTDDMLHATLALAQAMGLSYECLPTCLDVDRGSDLITLAGELETVEGLIPQLDFPQRTHALLCDLLPWLRSQPPQS